jgi:hypothetical protein
LEPTHRSIHPNIRGVPWWAALVIAITATAIGYAIDAGSGHKELTHVFAGLYIVGCLAAVLAVRQDGLFTAIIQPPLILFCAVPGAYWLFHGRKTGHLKDLLINCGYPLIERFPLMLGAAGVVLLIGLVRWYSGMLNRTTPEANTTDDTATATGTDAKSFVSGIVAKLNSYLGFDSEGADADDAASADSKRARATTRKAASKTGRASSSGRSATRSTRTRSRHARPSLEDQDEPVAERPRRRRQAPPRDFDPADPPRRARRRPMPDGEPDLHAQPPRESRRDSRTRRNPYERPHEGPISRSGRFDGYDRYEPPGTPGRFSRYEPYEPYESYEPSYEAPRRPRATPGASNGANPTHHPISRVRYRGEGPSDEPRAEPRPERRSQSRAPRRPPAESWEYDV